MEKKIWSLLMIVSLSTLGIIIRYLALEKTSFAQSLILRGFACVIITAIYAKATKDPLLPKNIKTQILRGLIAGSALALFSVSYTSLPASMVSALSQIDVPLIIILSPFVGQHTSLKSRALAILSIILLTTLIMTLETTHYPTAGLIYLFSGTFLLSVGYLLIKKSLAEESLPAMILTPSAALMIYGLVLQYFENHNATAWTAPTFYAALLSGLFMFLSYIATAKLYEKTSIAEAEFPTLISSVLLFPLEFYLLNQNFEWSELVYTLSFLVIIYYMIKTQDPTTEAQANENSIASSAIFPPEIDLPLVKQHLDYTCGAACVQSLLQYFKRPSLTELEIAKQLGTIELGFTPPESIVSFLKNLNLNAQLHKKATSQDLKSIFDGKKIIFVTWWDEDAGHYSLVKHLDDDHITLMDPWLARDNQWNKMKLLEFENYWQARGSVLIVVTDEP